jgi:hypothetical protein
MLCLPGRRGRHNRAGRSRSEAHVAAETVEMRLVVNVLPRDARQGGA